MTHRIGLCGEPTGRGPCDLPHRHVQPDHVRLVAYADVQPNDEARMFDHHDDICPICGRPGDHWLCEEIEVEDWNRSFGLDELKD